MLVKLPSEDDASTATHNRAIVVGHLPAIRDQLHPSIIHVIVMVSIVVTQQQRNKTKAA